jgi:hypothetical protein
MTRTNDVRDVIVDDTRIKLFDKETYQLEQVNKPEQMIESCALDKGKIAKCVSSASVVCE